MAEKSLDFLLKNPDFLLKNPDFLLKRVKINRTASLFPRDLRGPVRPSPQSFPAAPNFVNLNKELIIVYTKFLSTSAACLASLASCCSICMT